MTEQNVQQYMKVAECLRDGDVMPMMAALTVSLANRELITTQDAVQLLGYLSCIADEIFERRLDKQQRGAE
jgi:hypothetical protein